MKKVNKFIADYPWLWFNISVLLLIIIISFGIYIFLTKNDNVLTIISITVTVIGAGITVYYSKKSSDISNEVLNKAGNIDLFVYKNGLISLQERIRNSIDKNKLILSLATGVDIDSLKKEISNKESEFLKYTDYMISLDGDEQRLKDIEQINNYFNNISDKVDQLKSNGSVKIKSEDEAPIKSIKNIINIVSLYCGKKLLL